MRAFLKKVFYFLLIPSVLYVPFTLLVLPVLLEATMGPNIKKQLAHSFAKAQQRDYDMVVLGNSRMFCGVNPDKFSIPTFNFSHNNDSYNQLYHKLLWLEKKHKKIQYVMLGVDYFQFGIFADSRNYIYTDYLGAAYQKDYPRKNYMLLHYKELLKPDKIRALFEPVEGKHGLKDNGQYIRYGKPKDEEFIKRDYKRKPIQEAYFEKIIAHCRKNGVKVFLVMPPLRKAELKNYTPEELAEFQVFLDKFIDDKTVSYFNFSTDPHYKWNDFIDFTHLNQASADRFSAQVNDSINAKLTR